MSMWTMIFLIVLCGMLLGAYSKHQETKHRIARDSGHNTLANSQREKELQQEVEQLRERVKVLERIATDERAPRQLSDEIERLRDQ